MPKAYDVGFKDGSSGEPQKKGRAYEGDKANKEYFRGYAEGKKVLWPNYMIVKCNCDSTIFPGIREQRNGYISITCPTCGRRYIKDGETYASDRELTILIK